MKSELSEDSYRYFLNISSLEKDTLHIKLQINLVNPVDTLRFIAPPVYADNPWVEQSSSNFSNLSIVGKPNNLLEYVSDSVDVGLYKCLSISFLPVDNAIDIYYDITFNYADTGKMPAPYFGTESAYWRGSYVFMIPYKEAGLVSIWRENFDISVNYEISPSIVFYGDPVPYTFYKNPYELLFSTCVINANIVAKGYIGRQHYQFVSIPKGEEVDAGLMEKVKENFQIILNDVVNIFGTIAEAPITAIFGGTKKGGCEGMYAFNMVNPWAFDSVGWFNMILAHETIHFWIGNRVGDYDAPWWKEGTTSYLGYLIAIRNNLSSDYFIKNKLLKNLSGDNSVNSFSLSDEGIRKNIFAPVNNCEVLVYDKGAQISMLIDRSIRTASGGKTSLDRVLGDFVRVYDGKAFSRDQYISFIKQQSGADVSGLFSAFVETVGAIPDSVLAENCSALISMGAFGVKSETADNRY